MRDLFDTTDVRQKDLFGHEWLYLRLTRNIGKDRSSLMGLNIPNFEITLYRLVDEAHEVEHHNLDQVIYLLNSDAKFDFTRTDFKSYGSGRTIHELAFAKRKHPRMTRIVQLLFGPKLFDKIDFTTDPHNRWGHELWYLTLQAEYFSAVDHLMTKNLENLETTLYDLFKKKTHMLS